MCLSWVFFWYVFLMDLFLWGLCFEGLIIFLLILLVLMLKLELDCSGILGVLGVFVILVLVGFVFEICIWVLILECFYENNKKFC